MVFEPIGGYPPIYRKTQEQTDPRSLESRGFMATNIVNVGKIMDSKKKSDLFMAFGSEESEFDMNRITDPHEYDGIEYREF